MKTYRYTHATGKARHCISYHDGVSTHKDGSPFFGLEICGNLRALKRFLRKLQGEGYAETP